MAAAVARDDVVEVQVLPVERLAAVLAGVFVALEDVVPGELHFLARQTVEHSEHDDARHAEAERDAAHGLGVGLAA